MTSSLPTQRRLQNLETPPRSLTPHPQKNKILSSPQTPKNVSRSRNIPHPRPHLTTIARVPPRAFSPLTIPPGDSIPHPKVVPRTSEKATRQQGGLFFRENSSNGGKAIRTFWRNTKFGKITCQGQNSHLVSHYIGTSYVGYQTGNSPAFIRLLFAFTGRTIFQSAIKSAA
jgi:hypothetical protein